MISLLQYMSDNRGEIIRLIIEHFQLTILSVFLAVLIGVPMGIAISYIKKLRAPLLGSANIVQAIPSLALLGFLIPFLGIGFRPAIFMVVVYSLLPIVKNTSTGLDSVSNDLVEAAAGIGMTPLQVLFKVKFPLALPVIMAGVRISAVTAVGLVTIAAFIGAGGLGYLVYSGIRTVNNAQILSGAIPACLLALGIDLLASRIERAVSPIPFRADLRLRDKGSSRRIRLIERVMLYVTMLVLGIGTVAIFFVLKPKTVNTIVIGAKDFTEQNIMGNMYASLIEEKTNIRVIRQLELGGTQIVFSALDNNELDMYVEYSGTAYTALLKQSETRPPEEIYDYAKAELFKKHGILMLGPIGFNNTYALAVRPDTAELYHLQTISDLARVGLYLTASPTLEFMNRPDGIQGLLKSYQMEFKSIIPLDGTPRYTALINQQSDVVDAYATDGLIKEFDLVVLEDDLRYFPPYDAAPMVKPELFKKYPELEPVMNLLEGQIDDEAMREMNYKVDVLKQKSRDVAEEFLISRGFIRP